MVAIAGSDRCHVLADDLDEHDTRVVLAMCLYVHELNNGRVPGRFTSEGAERWARVVLSGDSPHDCATTSARSADQDDDGLPET